MTSNDMESELSYAYLHAIAAKVGVACQSAGRALDNDGVDAVLHTARDFGPDAILTEISLNVQLKATVIKPTDDGTRLSYFVKSLLVYDRLRLESVLPPKFLAVMFLPKDETAWLEHTAEQLVMRRCVYWVTLAGAPESRNTSGQSVYLPKSQVLSPDGLLSLFARVARREELRYVG